VLQVGEDRYLEDCATTDRWYHRTLIDTFGMLCGHRAHCSTGKVEKLFVICNRPSLDVEEEYCIDIGETSHIVSVFYSHQHFVTVNIDVMNKVCTVYDGLRYKPITWVQHVTNVLKRFRLIDLQCSANIHKNEQQSCEIEMWGANRTKLKWNLRLDESLVQTDSVNCGPLACAVTFQLLVDAKSFPKLETDTLRRNVIQT
jgi:hypothetical protein